MSEPTCEERINEQLTSRLNSEVEEGYEDEDPYSGVLSVSVDVLKRVDILLSYGGPSDGFKVLLLESDGEWEVYEVTYYFEDWFDGATRILNEKQTEEFLEIYEGLLEVYRYD